MIASLHHLKIPLRRPFGHVLATRDHAEAIVVVLEDGGTIGVGESVPRPYVTGETFDTAWQAIRGIRVDALRIDATSPASLARSVEQLPLPGLAARCAVELALLDLHCKRAGWPLSALAMGLPPALVSEAPLPEIISVPLDLHSEPDDLARRVGPGVGHVKIKVGAELAADVRRVAACRARFGASVTMSIDANMAWTVDETARAADALRRFDLAWIEEPLQPALRDRYPALRVGIPIMLDESVCSVDDARRAIERRACALINIRLSKHGGFLAALRIAALAQAAGVGYQHGCQVGQLGILNAAGRHFTRTVRGIVACEGGPGLANLCDYPTRDQVELDWQRGHLVGLCGPGLGVEIDRDKLARYAVRAEVLA